MVDTAVKALHAGGEVLCVVPQDIYEFWAIATRPMAAEWPRPVHPRVSGPGRPGEAVVPPPPGPAGPVGRVGSAGRGPCLSRPRFFDARLVAAMRTHGITRLLTFNGADFARFPGVSVLDPATIAGQTKLPGASP